ncbi:MAG TPA: ATP-binding cassette domain-containing protein [Candidatus Elarobacter sp.]
MVKTYKGGVEALRGISLRLSPGIVGLLGPNGAGKSTLMRIIATVTKPTAGTVRWDGTDVVKDPRPLRAAIGYLPQDAGVYPHLDAREFLDYIAALKRLPSRAARAQIAQLLDDLDLTQVANRPLGTLSGGNRQRVAIAQALLGDPHLLVVDEPTVGLDPQQRVRFRDLLARLARDRIILLSTHVVSDVETTADRLVVVAAGRVVADGTRAAVIAGHASLEAAYLSSVGSAA